MNSPNRCLFESSCRDSAGHRARRLIDAPDAAFADPFVLMAEDWRL